MTTFKKTHTHKTLHQEYGVSFTNGASDSNCQLTEKESGELRAFTY